MTLSAESVAPYAPCDELADDIDRVLLWWNTLPRTGMPHAASQDMLSLVLASLRARAYEAAHRVREHTKAHQSGALTPTGNDVVLVLERAIEEIPVLLNRLTSNPVQTDFWTLWMNSARAVLRRVKGDA